METIGGYRDYIGIIGVMLGLYYWDNGKEHGKYHIISGYAGFRVEGL